MITLVLGGVRSGKSRYAEQLAAASGQAVTYVATATVTDQSMQARITQHRTRRPQDWQLIEESLHLSRALDSLATSDGCVLVDCLSLWMTNLLMSDDNELPSREMTSFFESLDQHNSEIILVSSEANMGIIPLGELSRQYCDRIGELHQQVAARADRVIFMIAGLPQVLKGAPI